MGLQGKHLVLDPERCTGCEVCELVCSFRKYRKFNPKLSAIRILYDYKLGRAEGVKVCTQCGSCVHSCPTGAIRSVDGIVAIDYGACTGCLACAVACPVGAIVVADGRPVKCDLCLGTPACVRYCTRGALRVS